MQMFFLFLCQEGTRCACTLDHSLNIITFTQGVYWCSLHCPVLQIDGLTRAKETAPQTLVSSCLELKRVKLIRSFYLFPCGIEQVAADTAAAPEVGHSFRRSTVYACVWHIWPLQPAHRDTRRWKHASSHYGAMICIHMISRNLL